ncbi:hypothetical protein ACJJH9_12175 [Microbulbifer sp. DLAB2-AF]|uniref:hypothetical protein n=1 Tax=unclassified Microbulbifer TaxID=2619833 RepID=UPI00403A8690
MFKKLLFLSVSIPFSVSAIAETQYCTGTIEDWDVTNYGYVYMDGTWNDSDNSQRVCHIEGEWGGISEATCKAWLSGIVAATLSGKTVKVKYENTQSCSGSDLGEWDNTVRAPTYIRHYD